MQEILIVIASGLKLDAEQFLADFKNGEDFLSEKEIAAKLREFIPGKITAALDTAKKVGRSEVNKRYSRLIKDSGFENPDSLEGDALLTAFLAWKDEQAASVDGDPKTMSREELLKLPAVKGIVNEVTAKAGEKFAAEKKALEETVKAAENTRKRLLLDKHLVSTAEKGRVNLGDTPEMKAARLNILKSQIDLNRIEIGEGEALKFLGSDGYEADLEKEILSLAGAAFGIVKQDPNKSGANPTQGGAKGANGNGEYVPQFTFPGGKAEFESAYMKADPQLRLQLRKDYNFQQEQQAAAGK